MSNTFLTIAYCLLYSVLNVLGAAIIKLRLKDHTLTDFTEWILFLLDFRVIIAFSLIFVSALVMFKALSSSAFSFTIPIATGINFLLTIIAGYYIFKDQINLVSLAGFALILGGIIILSLNNNYHAK